MAVLRPSRRHVLRAALALAGASLLPSAARASPRYRFTGYPFTLGVASGYPAATAVTLWTRLAPSPLEAAGGMLPESIAVDFEVAEDEAFGRVVASGTRLAIPERGHAVHVDVEGLAPGRWYFYRFRAGDEVSPVGRTRTAEVVGTAVQRLRVGVGSCQHYEQGYYAAHRHLAGENLDLMLFLGDYIYEATWGNALVRRYAGGEARTLGDYRVRYAQHRGDADLQRLHGQVPWAVLWDDHEVDNDWAGDQAEHLEPQFLERRTAAFQTFFEHMPLPARMRPAGTGMRIHDTLVFGDLARIHLLDDRQYRSPQACPDPVKGGGSTDVDPAACASLADPTRTMLGAEQERWLDASLAASGQRWNLLAQQTLVQPAAVVTATGQTVWTDAWDGYAPARQRLLDSLRKRRVANPIFLGGDIHATVAGDLHADPGDVRTPIVASELCGTSISSQGNSVLDPAALSANHPHVRYANTKQRGYLVVELTPSGMHAQLRAVDEKRRDSEVTTPAAFTVVAGRPGLQVG